MRTKQLLGGFYAFCVAPALYAAPNQKPPPEPQDVNVVNTPSVTVINPRFIGFSNDSVQGDAGLVGMHTACASTYGAGARMCLDIEVIKTPDLQPIQSVASGWIQPTNTLLNANTVWSLSCYGWTVNGASVQGMVLSGERMQINPDEITYPAGIRTGVQANCIDLRPVACCK